jgi:hypothetical protein
MKPSPEKQETTNWQDKLVLISDSKLVFGAIGGLSLAFIIERASGAPLQWPTNWSLILALYCCAIMVPLSITGFQLSVMEGSYKKRLRHNEIVKSLLVLNTALMYGAIGLVLWSLQPGLAYVYTLFTVAGLYYHLYCRRQLLDQNKQRQAPATTTAVQQPEAVPNAAPPATAPAANVLPVLAPDPAPLPLLATLAPEADGATGVVPTIVSPRRRFVGRRSGQRPSRRRRTRPNRC